MKETVVRTDLEHGHVAEIIEQADGSLRARCLVCGDAWKLRRTTAQYDLFGRKVA